MQIASFIVETVLAQLCPAQGSAVPRWQAGRPPLRLLDVGAGDASLAQQLLPHFPGGVLAVDCNASLLLGDPVARSGSMTAVVEAPPVLPGMSTSSDSGGPTGSSPGVERVVADFLQLELPAGSQFDLVLAAHVLYQVS